jgi:hypothetical protein
MSKPFLVVGDGSGNIFEIPDYFMCGMSGTEIALPDEKDLISLPYGSDMFELPGRIAIGYDPNEKRIVEVKEYKGNRVYPVAAFMAPAHLQLCRSTYGSDLDSPRLPLYNYAAVGWKNNDFYVTGMRIDQDIRQDLQHFNAHFIEKEGERLLAKFPSNRLVHHLVENWQMGMPDSDKPRLQLLLCWLHLRTARGK